MGRSERAGPQISERRPLVRPPGGTPVGDVGEGRPLRPLGAGSESSSTDRCRKGFSGGYGMEA